MLSALPAIGEVTALDRYVAAPDPSYRYQLIETIPGDGYATHVLEMTSQRWRDEAEVDRPLWKHWLTVICARAGRHRHGAPDHRRRLERASRRRG